MLSGSHFSYKFVVWRRYDSKCKATKLLHMRCATLAVPQPSPHLRHACSCIPITLRHLRGRRPSTNVASYNIFLAFFYIEPTWLQMAYLVPSWPYLGPSWAHVAIFGLLWGDLGHFACFKNMFLPVEFALTAVAKSVPPGGRYFETFFWFLHKIMY